MRPARLGLKASALFAAWTLLILALAARGALKGRGGLAEGLGPLPEFRLAVVSGEGERPLGRADLLGRPWVADFIFTRCSGPCPVLSAEMRRLQDELPEAVRLVTFTVDPDHDDAATLARYARRLGARPGRWLFVRGDKAELYKLVYQGFKLSVAEDRRAPPGARVIHTTRFALVDQDGRVRGLYGSEALKALRRDARALAQEAGHG